MPKYSFLLLLFFAITTLSTAPACKAKYGCPSNEQVKPSVNKRGKMKSGKDRNRSELFDKKTRKRMGGR